MATSSRHYHRLTAYQRHDMTPHRLDWAGQPRQYKIYPALPDVMLPEISRLYDHDLRDILSGGGVDTPGRTPPLKDLSRVLYLANGLTGRTRHQGGYFYYRSPPSAGALYPNELYLVWFGSEDLDPGLYHTDPYQRRLTRLRPGNLRNFFPTTAGESGLFLISGIFFRSAWKYRQRGYRYVLLDGGHLIESTRLALAAAGLTSTIHYDFDDHQYNRLLGVDPDREACLAAIHLAGPPGVDTDRVPALADLPAEIANASRVSDRETVYEEIDQAHRAGSNGIPAVISTADIETDDPFAVAAEWQALKYNLSDGDDPIGLDFAETVLRRRSRRNFIPAPVSAAQFSCLLEMVCRASLTGNNESPTGSHTVHIGFLCYNVEGTVPGFYRLDPRGRRIGRVTGQDLIPGMTAACLDQEWLKNAGLHLLFLTDLAFLDRHLGARGYRYAMMTAGRLGHVVYLAATAMGLGCCGIGAFYDQEAEQLLGLKPTSALLYLTAVGQIR
jgi:SagB-type dehydrogenase family enzyme